MATNAPGSIRAVMTEEINRISSLADFRPSWMRPSACLLARWGFYWDGISEGVLICVYCRQTADRSILEDNPLERHRRKNPICPMFKDASKHSSVVPQDVLHKYYLKGRHNRPFDSTDSCLEDIPGMDRSNVSRSFYVLLDTLKNCVDRASSHGVFNSNTILSTPSVLNRLDPDFQTLRNEAARLATFHDWPVDAQAVPEQLAKAGFFYTGTIDRVQCAYCQNFLRNWVESDIPMEEHRNRLPDCRFAQGTVTDNESVDGGYRMESKEKQAVTDYLYKGVDLRGKDNDDQGHSPPTVLLGSNAPRKVVRQNMPSHAEFTDETKRMQSFINKTIPKGQNVNVLANAGFFHIGPNDNAKCFYCNGGLKNWCPSDDPWVEHARWFPLCGFLRSRRDPGYIKVIQDAFRPIQKAIEDWKAKQGTKDEESIDVEAVVTPEQSATPVAGASACEDTALAELDDSSKTMSKANKKKNKKKKNKAAKRDQKNEESAAAQEGTSTALPDRTVDEEARAVYDENRTLHEFNTCKVCMDEDVNVVFLPCGHLACCNNCAPSLPHCPICRGLIRGTVRVFLS